MKIILIRTGVVLLWLFLTISTMFSYLSNPAPKWYDIVSIFPTFLLLLTLVNGSNKILYDELDGWLAKIMDIIDRMSNQPKQ